MRPDGSETVYRGRWLTVTVERWGDRDREIVERPGVVAIVAVDCEGFVTLVRQLREPVRRELLELPAGLIEKGETPLETARRELAEETGLRGGRWRAGPAFFSTPGFCRERVHLFVAEGLERGESAPAGDERIELERWPVEAVAARLGGIEDAKTLAGLTLYLLERQQALPGCSPPGEAGS
jgi:ADP-ribose pyrophosphatase